MKRATMKEGWIEIDVMLDGAHFAKVHAQAETRDEARTKARAYVKRCHPVLTDADIETT